MSPFLLEPGGEPTPLGDVNGSVQGLAWSADGTSVFAVAVDEGGFGAATDGAIRLRWSDAPDPTVFRPETGWRRLRRIVVESG